MAGRSFLRRLLGNRSAVELDDVSTAPNPGGFTPVPYPNTTDGDGPAAVATSTGPEDRPDGATQPELAGQRLVAAAEPTAFDEADAVFGTRTEVPEAKEDDGARALISDDRTAEGIIAPNNVVDGTDDGIAGQDLLSPTNVAADPIDGIVVRDPDGNVVAVTGDEPPPPAPPARMEKEELIDAAPDKGEMSKGNVSNSDLDEGIVGQNGIVSPNNVVADPDDDLVLADLSSGSIGDQLTANAGFSSDATEFGLTDDLDDLDDVDVD